MTVRVNSFSAGRLTPSVTRIFTVYSPGPGGVPYNFAIPFIGVSNCNQDGSSTENCKATEEPSSTTITRYAYSCFSKISETGRKLTITGDTLIAVGVAVGNGVSVHVGVAVGIGVSVGTIVNVAVGTGVSVGTIVKVAVGIGVSVGAVVAVGAGVLVGAGVDVAAGRFVAVAVGHRVLVATGTAVSVAVGNGVLTAGVLIIGTVGNGELVNVGSTTIGVGAKMRVAVATGVLLAVGNGVLVTFGVGDFHGIIIMGTGVDVGINTTETGVGDGVDVGSKGVNVGTNTPLPLRVAIKVATLAMGGKVKGVADGVTANRRVAVAGGVVTPTRSGSGVLVGTKVAGVAVSRLLTGVGLDEPVVAGAGPEVAGAYRIRVGVDVATGVRVAIIAGLTPGISSAVSVVATEVAVFVELAGSPIDPSAVVALSMGVTTMTSGVATTSSSVSVVAGCGVASRVGVAASSS